MRKQKIKLDISRAVVNEKGQYVVIFKGREMKVDNLSLEADNPNYPEVDIFEGTVGRFDDPELIKAKVIPEHQQRVLVELEELENKFAALGEFIGSDFFRTKVDKEDQELLVLQHAIMQPYVVILKQRVDKF